MFSRSFQPQNAAKSFFLFGPRGTGKSAWVRDRYPDSVFVDLLETDLFGQLLAAPHRLEGLVPAGHRGPIVIDEVQKVPALLDEVHRLIERRKLRFVLTGSSARKLKRQGTNLLAGRARTYFLHPLTAEELGNAFDLKHALAFGGLPAVWVEDDPAKYLSSYVATYLREEVQQESITRNLAAFTRFLEAASFSQGSALTIAEVARECAVDRKSVENWFGVLEDLLLAVRLPMFRRRAQRELAAHPKFYFFDAGVYRAIRPRGPLDTPSEIGGAAAETLVWQHLRAINDYGDFGYQLHYWRTRGGLEVDFVLYGERGIRAFEVKSSATVRPADLAGLRAFLADYSMAKATLIYGGTRSWREGEIDVVPLSDALVGMRDLLK